jgi:hypothetical protein
MNYYSILSELPELESGTESLIHYKLIPDLQNIVGAYLTLNDLCEYYNYDLDKINKYLSKYQQKFPDFVESVKSDHWGIVKLVLKYPDLDKGYDRYHSDIHVNQQNKTIPMKLDLQYYAIKNKNLRMVKYLGEYGLNFNINNLHTAIDTGSLEIVTYLIDKGILPNNETISGAVKFNHLRIIEYLYTRKPSLALSIDVGLRYSVRFGVLSILKWFVSNTKCELDNTLIKECIQQYGTSVDNSRHQILEYLCTLGLKPSQVNIYDFIRAGDSKALKIFYDFGYKYNVDDLIFAIANTYESSMIVNLLIQCNVYPSKQCIFTAIAHNKFIVLQKLLNSATINFDTKKLKSNFSLPNIK